MTTTQDSQHDKFSRDIPTDVAHIISSIFSPLLIPTYGIFMALWTSILMFLPLKLRWGVVSVTFVITCIIPLLAILSLWRLGYISRPSLNSREERTVPYIITGLCYLGCAFYLSQINAPGWIIAFPAGGCLAVAICSLINLKWKISAHLAAMGGLLAMMFRIASLHVNAVPMNGWLTVLVILAGIIGSSRILLKCHTSAQVVAGTAVGFLSVYLMSVSGIF